MSDIGSVEDILKYYENGGVKPVIVDNDSVYLYNKDGKCIFERFGSSIVQVEPFLDYLDIPNSGP